jgi:hypothetical protein
MQFSEARQLAHEIAAEEDVDPRSVLRRIAGKPIKGPAGRRIDAALQRRGIGPMECESPVATPGLADTNAGHERNEHALFAAPAQVR